MPTNLSVFNALPAVGWFAIYRTEDKKNFLKIPLVCFAIMSDGEKNGIVPMICEPTGVVVPAMSKPMFDSVVDDYAKLTVLESERVVVIGRNMIEVVPDDSVTFDEAKAGEQ